MKYRRRMCAFCGKLAEGNYSVHRDGFGEGPEVDLCDKDGCGESPSLDEIWSRTAKCGPYAYARKVKP